MSLYTSGKIKQEIMDKFKQELNYLLRTGFDVVLDYPIPIYGKRRVKYKANSFFPENKAYLPIPFRSGDISLSRSLMEFYKIETEVDLARYLRIISIIVTNFTGPEEKDHLRNHTNRLKATFEYGLPTQTKENAMITSLLVYEQALGRRSSLQGILKESDYLSFVRVLNSIYHLYKVYKAVEPKSFDERKKDWAISTLRDMHDKRLLEMLKNSKQRALVFKRLKENNIYDIASEEKLLQLVELPEKRKELVQIINSWVWEATGGELDLEKRSYLNLLIDLTDERLLQKLNDKQHRKLLLDFLKRYDIHDVDTDKELYSYIHQDDARAVLLKKIQEYHKKWYKPF